MDLTAKQKMFADEYIKTGNAKQSYISAGYKGKGNTLEVNASRLLRNAKVMDYIKEMNKTIQKATIADMTEVKEFWTNILRSREQDPRDRLKASELIAKTNGAFIEKVEAVNENLNTDMTNLSPEERQKRIDELLKKRGV